MAVIFLVALFFACNKLVAALSLQFASPVVLSGSLAIQVFKRPMEVCRGQRAELACEKSL